MTVPSTTSRETYAGDGVSTAFPYSYYFLANADLVVLLVDSDGNSTTQVLTTNYTVTGAGVPAGGTVTMLVAPPTGYTLVIYRDPPVTQLVDYQPNDPFPAETHERALDKITMWGQRLAELVSRSFRLPDSDTSGASTELPAPSASKVIGWAADAQSLQNYSTSDFATVAAAGNPTTQFFSGDGVTTVFTLSSEPVSLPNLEGVISGVDQYPGIDYTLSGTSVTFAVAPPAGTDNIMMRWTTAIASPVTVSDGSITLAKLADGVLEATAAGLAKMADGFLAASAAGRAKMADGFVTLAKLSSTLISGATAETAPAIDDALLLSDTSAGTLDKITLENMLKVINGLTEDTTPDQNADYMLTYDSSASTVKKVLLGRNGPSAGVVATTSGTAVDINTAVPTWVTEILLMFSGVSSSGTSNWLIQVGSGSYATSGYVDTGNSFDTTPGASTSTAGFLVNEAVSAAATARGHVLLTKIPGTNTWVMSGNLSSSAPGTTLGAGEITLGGALDRIRWTTAGGADTADAGSIGYRCR